MEFARVDLITDGLPYIVAGMFSPRTRFALHPGDAVQLAANLAVLRDQTQWGKTVSAAWYKGGKYQGVTPALTRGAWASRVKKGQTPIQIWGDSPLRQNPLANVGLPANYGKSLGLACEWAIYQIGEAKRGGAPPGDTAAAYSALGMGGGSAILDSGASTEGARFVDWDGGTSLAGPPVVAAIIVAGVAVSVVGGVAAWRYFDPAVRREEARITGAAMAYRDRIKAWLRTGKMPPPSSLEKLPENVAVVEAAAKAASSASWKWGLGLTLAGLAAVGAYGAATRYGKAA